MVGSRNNVFPGPAVALDGPDGDGHSAAFYNSAIESEGTEILKDTETFDDI